MKRVQCFFFSNYLILYLFTRDMSFFEKGDISHYFYYIIFCHNSGECFYGIHTQENLGGMKIGERPPNHFA